MRDERGRGNQPASNHRVWPKIVRRGRGDPAGRPSSTNRARTNVGPTRGHLRPAAALVALCGAFAALGLAGGPAPVPEAPAGHSQQGLPRLFLPRVDRRESPRREPSATAPPAATLAPGGPSATWPAPSATPEPLPSATPVSWRNGAPPARLVAPGLGEQAAGVAEHCWRPLGLCIEHGGIPTQADPLRLPRAFVARLLHAPAQQPVVHRLSILRAADLAEVGDWDGLRWWDFAFVERDYDLLLQREQDIQVSREPGLYVLQIYIVWEDLGDVNYGFLVELLP